MDYEGMSDESLGLLYLDAKKSSNEAKSLLDETKPVIFQRLELRGVKRGSGLLLEAGKVRMKKEVRVTEVVNDEKAVTMLEHEKLGEYVHAEATIAIKKDVDAKKIPQSVIHSMEKYFDIVLHKSVSKDFLKGLLAESRITQEQYDAVMESRVSEALKVELV